MGKRVRIRVVAGEDQWRSPEGIRIDVDGELVATGEYGGEPEDNCEGRDYSWVKDALADLARKLGAEVEIDRVEVPGGYAPYAEALYR